MRALELAKQRHAEALQVQAALILCRVQHARRQTVHAWHALQSLATQTRSPALLREVQSWRARLALATGDLEFVQRWHAAITAQREQVPRVQQEREALIAARWQLVQGNTQAALELLEGWRADAAAQGRTRSEIEILVLKALAHSAQAEQVPAEQALARALTLGQARGIRRIFLDEGDPIAALLLAIAPNLTKRALAAYAATLLRA
jgi:LuxR family maltose regulon positive regulatory protein